MIWFTFAMLASIAWTFASLAQKDATHHEHAIQVGVAAGILQAAFALTLIPFANFNFPTWIWPLLIVSGVIIAFGFYYSVKAFKMLDSSVVSPLFNLGTIVVIVLSVTLLHEKLTAEQLFGVSLLIFGAYILELKRGHLLSPFVELYKSNKIHIVIWCTLFYSLHAVLGKYLLNFIDPVTYLFIETLVLACVLVAIAYLRHEGTTDIKKGFSAHKKMIFAIAILNLSADLFAFLALRAGEASLVVPVIRTWTLFVVILGGTFFKEGHLRNRILATIVMLAGIFIIYL